MLFKLLSDYAPRGVAVAWDTPVHGPRSRPSTSPNAGRCQTCSASSSSTSARSWRRSATATSSSRAGSGRRDRNARDPGRRSRNQDLRRLHRSRRVPARLRERVPDDDSARRRRRPRVHTGASRAPLRDPADRIPDFIGLKGDTSDNIPGVPGIGDKTAGQLIAQYGSVEVLEHAGEFSPARSRAISEHAEQTRDSKILATMRRDLEPSTSTSRTSSLDRPTVRS